MNTLRCASKSNLGIPFSTNIRPPLPSIDFDPRLKYAPDGLISVYLFEFVLLASLILLRVIFRYSSDDSIFISLVSHNVPSDSVSGSIPRAFAIVLGVRPPSCEMYQPSLLTPNTLFGLVLLIACIPKSPNTISDDAAWIAFIMSIPICSKLITGSFNLPVSKSENFFDRLLMLALYLSRMD